MGVLLSALLASTSKRRCNWYVESVGRLAILCNSCWFFQYGCLESAISTQFVRISFAEWVGKHGIYFGSLVLFLCVYFFVGDVLVCVCVVKGVVRKSKTNSAFGNNQQEWSVVRMNPCSLWWVPFLS